MDRNRLALLSTLWLNLSIVAARRQSVYKIIKQKRKMLGHRVLRRLRAAFGEFELEKCALNNLFLTCHARPRFRTIGKKKRCHDFWNRIVNEEFKDEDWLENFRMKKQTFTYIVESLRDKLKKIDKSKQSVTMEKQVAVALYKLASCCEYRAVGALFGIHNATVHKCLYKFVEAINEVLLLKYIKFPDAAEAKRIAESVKSYYKIEQVFGFIDGTHILILPPRNGYRDFINRKGWPSIILQAVVDAQYIFRDISIKYPGSCLDAFAFKGGKLYQNCKNIIPQYVKNVDGMLIPLMLLGDPAYPLLPWLLKGYTGSLNAEEESFNVYLSSARMSVENAFGRLKARWRCLAKRADLNYKFIPSLIATCRVLHNIVESRKDSFDIKWMNNVNAIKFPQPSNVTVEATLEAEQIRDHLKQFMWNNDPQRKSVLRNYFQL